MPTTVPQLVERAKAGRRIVVLTAYDFGGARLVAAAGVDAIMVGDSLGVVVQGRPNTLGVTLDQMVYHCEMVSRGAPDALVIGDLPFMSYQEGSTQAVRSAGRLVKEGGCTCVKLEGGMRMAAQIAAIVRADIPVMGHIGLTPQSIHQLGGYRVQRDADRLLADARAVQEAGAWSVVLECVPREIAAQITAQLEIPTIGIGAGPECSGQVLVFHDILGLYDDKPMRFIRRYADLKTVVTEAVMRYREDVESGRFPATEHCFTMGTSGSQGE